MDIAAYLADRARAGKLSGAVYVRRHGQVVLDQGFGAADRASGRPNTPATAFQIASISKQFTAVAILLLCEQGLLSVDERIARWVRDSPEPWQPIIVHHLLTHTTGICHWRDYPALSPYDPLPREQLLAIFANRPLKFPPGGGWAYSSPAFVLLAHIVEQVAGMPYAAFLRQRIFEPLGMADSCAGTSSARREQQALGYDGKRRLRTMELDTVNVGAGDIWSSTRDLCRWDAALAAPGLLSAESLRAMFTPHALTVDFVEEIPGTTYGYGWCLATVAGRSVRYHPGDNDGFQSLNLLLPDEDSAIILLCNDERSDLTGIGLHLLRELTQTQ